MPRLSVWMVRTALVYFIVGFAFGAVMLTHKAAPLPLSLVAALRPLHVELLTLGWTVNLALGVGYWILPRHASGAERGAEGAVALAFVLLNAGVLSVGFGQAFGAPRLPLAGRLAEAGAAAAFALHAWRRVKPYGAGRPSPTPRSTP